MIGTILTYELVLLQFDKSQERPPLNGTDVFCKSTNRVT